MKTSAARVDRTRHDKLRREILRLRAEVGEEMSKSLVNASGIRLQMYQIQEEYVPELFTLQGRIGILDRMSNDPVVAGLVNAITSALISGVRWKVVGGSQEQQDLVHANILCEGPSKFWCITSWQERLYETLSFLSYGFAMFLKRIERVEDKAIFREIKWLHPRSLEPGNAWNMDEHDNLISIRRRFTNAKGASVRDEINAKDLFFFPWDKRGPNWEGKAFIRPAYKPWKIRELAEKIDMIDLQNRGVGVPMAKLAPGGGGVIERDRLVQILKDLRGGSKERPFIVIQNDEEVKFLTSEGNVREAQTILDGKASDISRIGVQQYLESGNTQSGSRAASSSMATGAFIHFDSVRIRLEDMMNFGAGPLPGPVQQLQDMNDDDIEEYARVEGSRISPTEQLDNIPLLTDAIQKQAVTKDIGIENEIRKRLGYPEISQKDFDRLNQRPIPSIGGRPDGAGTDQEGRDDTMSRRFAGAEKKSPDATRTTSRSASYPWVKSNPPSTGTGA